jgi:hypothetical protein
MRSEHLDHYEHQHILSSEHPDGAGASGFTGTETRGPKWIQQFFSSKYPDECATAAASGFPDAETRNRSEQQQLRSS